jgi:hypothetical protein
MTTRLDVLVVENRRHAADEAAAALQAAGHRVHRCLSPDGPGFPCTAIAEPGSCPIDQGIDVAFAVRDRIEPRPTRYEVGAGCAIRAGIPLAERGPEGLDPFDPWVTVRSGSGDDVVAAVEAAAEKGLDDLRAGIISRVAPLLPATEDPSALRCSFERLGLNLVVHLFGPPVGKRVEQAMAVRVLDAIWHADRTHGQVDVRYHPSLPASGDTDG